MRVSLCREYPDADLLWPPRSAVPAAAAVLHRWQPARAGKPWASWPQPCWTLTVPLQTHVQQEGLQEAFWLTLCHRHCVSDRPCAAPSDMASVGLFNR